MRYALFLDLQWMPAALLQIMPLQLQATSVSQYGILSLISN